MSHSPINPLGERQVPTTTPPQSSRLGERLKTSSTGLFRRFITVPDRHPKMRYVYDIGIIAIAVISIISLLIATQGQGLMVYALIPALALGALGVTMLISDVIGTPKAKKVAEAMTAIIVPMIVLAIAAGLIAGACAVSGGTVLVFANPMFIMGLITVGLYFMSLNKLTLNYFRTACLIKEQRKTQNTVDPIILRPATVDDAKKVFSENKKDIAADAQRQRRDGGRRQDNRIRRVRRHSQGSIDFRSRGKTATTSSSEQKTNLDEFIRRNTTGFGSTESILSSSPQLQERRSTLSNHSKMSLFMPIQPASSSINFSIPNSVHPEPLHPSKEESSSSYRVTSSSRRSSRDSSRDDRDEQGKQQQKENKNKKQSKKKGKKTDSSSKASSSRSSSPSLSPTNPFYESLSPSFDQNNPFSDGYDDREGNNN
ncbi:hypothetical protein C10C_0409 [Chlamydia serpentis]|uniref:Uncharacterized protein n=1 Tax=Chlamydia serpentis TaxID=1967782 RepID=A0A2R8FAX1_9CHLA|nr:IncV family inclusion membrane protein [Chlamydia serpentis]SPN73578.1 hypothetical protein C10C_0409 [Chlamydia serpentis]